MPRPRLVLLLTLALAAVAAGGASGFLGRLSPGATPTSTQLATVDRYSVLELTFEHDETALVNPWEDVSVRVTLRSPQRSMSVGGFRYSPGIWKTRVAPGDTGRWHWSAEISDMRGSTVQEGQFDVVDRGAPGFVGTNPLNPYRFVTSNGKPYLPIGYEHSLSDDTGNGTPFDEIGFDGGTPSACSADPRCITVRRHDGSVRWSGWVTDLNTELDAFAKGGFNLYRWSVDNASFKLWDKIEPSGNVYLEREGRWGDELVSGLRRHDIRVFMTIFGAPPYLDENCGPRTTGTGLAAPHAAASHSASGADRHANSTGPPGHHTTPGHQTGGCDAATADGSGLNAVKRYARYVVDRYGAYVDFWELMNEGKGASDVYVNELAAAIRERDPYQHRISTSWERPQLASIEVTAPHWYATEGELTSDTTTMAQIGRFRGFGKPVVFGEQGNDGVNWDARSATRYRLRSWTALFDEAALITWDFSAVKEPTRGIGALYIGPEERASMAVLSSYQAWLTADAVMAPITLSAGLRGSGLVGKSGAWAYVLNSADHTGVTRAGRVTLRVPKAGMAVFVSPLSGAMLGSAPVTAGQNTLRLPDFVTDIAIRTVTP